MKKFLTVVVLVLFAFTILPSPMALAGGAAYKDNMFDSMGDWMATLGKSGMEKEQILAERKAGRMKRHAEIQAKKARQQAEKEAKKAGKDADKAGKDMKKKFGL